MAQGRVVVVGLGPGGPDLTTLGAVEALAAAPHRYLRTHRHPAAAPYLDDPSFDHRYEAADAFAEVYDGIVEDLVAAAARHGEVAYAVPGSPYVLEASVAALRADDRVEVEVVAGMSFLDLAWGRLGVDPVEAGVRLVDGHRFAEDAAGATGALLVAHCHANHVLSDLKLAWDDDEPDGAIVLQRLGLPDEAIVEVDWADLDRTVVADHLTSIYIPEVRVPVAGELVRFEQLVRTLRDRCPWDREQTHASLGRYLLEESYEVLEAIDGLEPDPDGGPDLGVEDLEEELGDLLFQVFFHATIAAESGSFTLGDVARGIHDKLRDRHPHVFPPPGAEPASLDAAGVLAGWEEAKRAEKGRDSVFDGVPAAMPALARAQKLLSKAERIGLATPAPAAPVADVGAELLALVATARAAGLDAEAELRRAADVFVADARDAEAAGERRP